MFDNEIDWVMRLKAQFAGREARGLIEAFNAFKYKAEHMQSGY